MINLLIIIFLEFNNCNKNELFLKRFNNNIKNDNNFNQSLNLNKDNYKKKNLILGIIENYSFNTILPFFKSLIKANFDNCDIVMFIRYVSPKIITYLRNIGVYIFSIPKKYIKVSSINVRWKMYTDFLKDKTNPSLNQRFL